ncbi:MAG: hypothetical protein WBB19_00415 [Desulforhopalus sp.]
MKNNRYTLFSLSSLFFLCSLFATGSVSFGGDDPSISGELRKNIQTSMQTFIDNNSVGGIYSIYDPVDGKLRQLTFKELHKGIVKKGDFYVSCADFTDSNNKVVDLDFLVMPTSDRLLVAQAIIHSVDGEKRTYHLEN